MFGITQKENVDNLHRLRNLRYWGKPNNLKRVNAHAEQRELSTSVLDCFFKFPNYQITRIKSGRSSYVLMSVAMLPYVIFVLRVRPYITFANIGINLQTCKKTKEKLRKYLELSKILRIFAPSKVIFDYPGKFPERASRIRHYPF